MNRNRLHEQKTVQPQPPNSAFMLCPASCFPVISAEQMLWQQSLYQWALAEAQAIVRPSLPERDLLAVWN